MQQTPRPQPKAPAGDFLKKDLKRISDHQNGASLGALTGISNPGFTLAHEESKVSLDLFP